MLGTLDAIESRQYNDDTRNTVEVFKRYRDIKVPSWEGIADALEKIDKIVLAQALRSKYVQTVTADKHHHEVALVQPNAKLIPVTTSSSSPAPQSQRTSPIILAKTTADKFYTINTKLVADIKDMIRRKASVAHFQDFLKEGYKSLPLSTTMETMLNDIGDLYSLYEYEFLQSVIENYLEDTQLKQKFDNFEQDLKAFTNSTVLGDLETKIVEKLKVTSGMVEIKLNRQWKEVTINNFIQFLKALNEERHGVTIKNN